MASLMANPVTNMDRPRESRRKRKKKSLVLSAHQNRAEDGSQVMENNRWRTATQQQNYSSKLLQALRHVRVTPPPSTPALSNAVPRRGRAIKDAADRALAVAAKGRTRWSKAILTNRLKLKFLKAKKPKVVSPSRTRKAPKVSLVRIKPKNLPAVQKKALVLGSLVPGCRKQPLSVVLEEAHDYISALEMQVRAMTALTELLSVAGALSGSLDPPPPPHPGP